MLKGFETVLRSRFYVLDLFVFLLWAGLELLMLCLAFNHFCSLLDSSYYLLLN